MSQHKSIVDTRWLPIMSTVVVLLAACKPVDAQTTAESRFHVDLAAHSFSTQLLVESSFGINTALRPDSADLEKRLAAMQMAGIKWGRQDFTWRRIEKDKGEFEFEPFDRLIEACTRHGILLAGDLTGARTFMIPGQRKASKRTAVSLEPASSAIATR